MSLKKARRLDLGTLLIMQHTAGRSMPLPLAAPVGSTSGPSRALRVPRDMSSTEKPRRGTQAAASAAPPDLPMEAQGPLTAASQARPTATSRAQKMHRRHSKGPDPGSLRHRVLQRQPVTTAGEGVWKPEPSHTVVGGVHGAASTGIGWKVPPNGLVTT